MFHLFHVSFLDFFEEREVSSGVPTVAGCVPGFEHRATAGKHEGRNRIQDVHDVYSDYQIKLQGPKILKALKPTTVDVGSY